MTTAIPSKPFPNGSTYEFFDHNFCSRCKKRKLYPDGMPMLDNCRIETAINEASLDRGKWPGNDIVHINGYSYICREFENDDLELMRKYSEMFIGRNKE